MTAKIQSAKFLVYINCHCAQQDYGNDPVSIMCRLYTGWFAQDRFGFLNHYLPFNIQEINDPIPNPGNCTKDLKDIIDERAVELIKLNKPISVLWSGGVDSTSIVCALIKNGISKDQLNIIHARSSIGEYPWFYDYLKKNQYNCIREEKVLEKAAELTEQNKGIIVTGWCADQLFGSNIHLTDLTAYHTSVIDGLRKLFPYRFMNLSDKSYETLEAVYSNYAKNFGLELTQFCELAWLFNFGIKWSHVSTETKLSLLTKELRDSVYNFYESIEFQEWSIKNFDYLKEVNGFKHTKFYKKPLKEYIHSVTNDDDYLRHKGKVNSWAYVTDNPNMEYITTFDSDGFRIFKLKTKTNDSINDSRILQKKVLNYYLKDEFKE